MRYLPRILSQAAIVATVLSDLALAAPDRPAPKKESPPQDPRIEPEAEKILRSAYKGSQWEAAVESATYKLLAIEESSGYERAIAASAISFSQNGQVAAQMIAIAQWTGDPNRIGTHVREPIGADPPATLIFDRPVKALKDIRAAKLREINWGGLSMNFRRGDK